MCTYAKRCAYIKAFGSIIHCPSLKLYLILTFVLMLIVIYSSLADWRHGMVEVCSACVRIRV